MPKDRIFHSNIPSAVTTACPRSAVSGGEFDGRLQQMEYTNGIFRLWAQRLNVVTQFSDALYIFHVCMYYIYYAHKHYAVLQINEKRVENLPR